MKLPKILYRVVDFVILFSVLFFSLVGKDLSEEVFKDINYVYSGFGYLNFLNVSLIFVVSLLFVFIQYLPFNILIQAFIYVTLGFLASIIILLSSELSSMMIFFCQIIVFAISAFCFLFRTYLSYEMKEDFWKIVFESLVKIVQISLVVYVAVIATLRFVHETDRSYLGFSSTIFYPTIIYLFMLFMFGCWAVYPVWMKLLDCYKK